VKKIKMADTFDANISKKIFNCEEIRRRAHSAPLNPFRLDADGHKWIAHESRAWADEANILLKAVNELKRMGLVSHYVVIGKDNKGQPVGEWQWAYSSAP
jgi:hypothetical protein